MIATSESISMINPQAYRAILTGGLMAGVFDLAAALIINGLKGVSPIRILQAIASGLLGMAAYRNGFKSAALGVVLHFLIAFVAAAVYYAASRRLDYLVRAAILSGLLYGIIVYLFMNFVVLPLSAFPHNSSFSFAAFIQGIIVHMLFVGLPISLSIRRYS